MTGFIFRLFATMENTLENLEKKDDEEANNQNDIKHRNFYYSIKMIINDLKWLVCSNTE